MRRSVLSRGLPLCLIAVPALLLSRPLRADALGDLRAALDRLSAVAPLKARVEIARTDLEKEKPKAERKGEAVVEHGPSGLSLHLDPAQLPKPGTKAERKRRNEATVRLEPDEALKLLDPARELKEMLEGATTVSEKSETFEGKAVRTLVLRPAPDLDEEDRKAVKRYEDVVTLRLDAENLPIALDRTVDVKVSKMLLSFTLAHRESRRFARHGGRLVTTAATEESRTSGLGQSGGSKTRWTVTPL